jgi:hypothetical protein
VVPTRVAEDVTSLVMPAWGVPDVTKHINPLVESNAEGIVRVDVLGETEVGCVIEIFAIKRLHETVELGQATGVGIAAGTRGEPKRPNQSPL